MIKLSDIYDGYVDITPDFEFGTWRLSLQLLNFFPCNKIRLNKLLTLLKKYCYDSIEKGELDPVIIYLKRDYLNIPRGLSDKEIKQLERNINDLKVFNGVYAR